MRASIEGHMGLDAVDIYGISEVMGPGVAQECIESKDGPCVWEDHFYPEVIDPLTGEVLPDGNPGELVFTSLTKQALPVVRYRTRDLTTLLPPTSRSMRRMARISGRIDDMLIIRGVNVFPSQIEEILFQCSGLTPHYYLEITRGGHLDELTVHCECIAGADPALAGRNLQHRIKAMIGISVRADVQAFGTIERSIGKATRVLDRRTRSL